MRRIIRKPSRSKRVKSAIAIGVAVAMIGCSGGEGGDEATPVGVATTVDGSTDSTNTGTDTSTTPTASVLNTLVTIAGSLALTSTSSSTSLALSSTQYWVKCVTLDLSNASACVDDTDTSGAFSLSCEGFKGKKFGCFILSGADQDSLEIKGMVSSDSLAAGESTESIDMGIEFDPDTGVAQTTKVEPKTAAGDVDSGAATLAAAIDTELQSLTITSSPYEFRFCNDNFDRNKATKGDFDPTQINESSCHHVEPLYVHFTPGSSSAKPTLELWRSEGDRTACYPGGTLTYAISDGTNEYSFPATPDFNGLYTAIVDNGWASQAALDRLALSQNETAKTESDDVSDLKGEFGENFCGVMVGHFTDAYASATIVSEHGFDRCDGVVIDSGNTDFDAEMNGAGEGPPPEWCVDYKRAAAVSDDEALAVKDRFILECNLHVKGGGDSEKIWAKRDLVEPFLRELGEVRHRSGNDRFADFKQVWESFDLQGVIEKVEAETALSADEKGDLQDLAIEWSKIADWDVRDKLPIVADNIDTPHDDLAIQGTAKTGAQWLAVALKSNRVNNEEQNFRLANLERTACEGSWELDFRSADLTAATITTFLSQVVPATPGSQDWRPAKADGVSDEWSEIITPVFDYLLATGSFASDEAQVSGCTAVNLMNQKQWLSHSSSDPLAGGGGQGGDPAWDASGQIFHQISESKRSTLIRAVRPKDPDGDSQSAFDDSACFANGDKVDGNCAEAREELTALRNQMSAVLAQSAQYMAWMLCSLCQLDGDALNADGGFTLGTTSGLQCGGTMTELQQQMYAPQLWCLNGSFSEFPSQDSNDSRDLLDKMGDMQREAFNFISHEAQAFDEGYQDTIRSIAKNSSCIPDATLGRDPILQSGASASTATADDMTFQLRLKAPAFRKMSGPVNKALKDTADTSGIQKFNVAEERLEKEGGGMGSNECVRGEVNRLSNFYLDGTTLYGAYTQAWKDTCFSSGNDDDDSEENSGEQGWYAFFKATPIAD